MPMKLKRMTDEQKEVLAGLKGASLAKLVVDVSRISFVKTDSQVNLWAVNAYDGELTLFEVSGLCPEKKTNPEEFLSPTESGKAYCVVAEQVIVEDIWIIHARLLDQWTDNAEEIDEDLELGVLLKLSHGYLAEFIEPYSSFFSPDKSKILSSLDEVQARLIQWNESSWLESVSPANQA